MAAALSSSLTSSTPVPTSRDSTRQLIRHLDELRGQFGGAIALRRLACMSALEQRSIRSAALLRRYHDILSYMRAFPDSIAVYRQSQACLSNWGERVALLSADQRWLLGDSGIEGTTVEHEFKFESAAWLAERVPDEIDVAWETYDDPAALHDLLAHVVLPVEQDYFEDESTTTQGWIEQARGSSTGTDARWILRQLQDVLPPEVCAPAYDSAEIPLRWRLTDRRCSRTHNVLARARCETRRAGMRRASRNARATVWRPLSTIRRLPEARAQRVIDVVTAALLSRAREVYAIRHANPQEVYWTEIGRGVSVAVVGVRPALRLGLESNYGFAILSNGVPVGYGGASTLFCQANTGINIFEEFRRSEASFMFVQTLRVLATLFGCRHFLVDPYQFGNANREAIDSGAFWFYYRLGFRPEDPGVRRLAAAEWQRLRRGPRRRTQAAVLRTLAHGHMVLQAPGARRAERFSENWLVWCGRAATGILSGQSGAQRKTSVARLAGRILRAVGGHALGTYAPSARLGIKNLAPILALSTMNTWPTRAIRAARFLLEAKGAPQERGYAVGMAEHALLRQSLSAVCRKMEQGRS